MNPNLARTIAKALSFNADAANIRASLEDHTEEEWKRGLPWLDRSGVALWFWERLKALGEQDAVPAEIGAQLERNCVDHGARVACMAEEFDSINGLLAKAGIEYAVLKGFALIPNYVPDARWRTSYDYDYLVGAESLARIAPALRNRGYIQRHERVDHPVVYVHAANVPRMPSRRDALYSSTLHRAVELHTRLWEGESLKIPLRLPDDLLARKRLRCWQGLRFYSLAEEDALMFQVLHAFRHILECWCRLVSFLEIAYCLENRRADSVFWRRFGERIRICPALAEMVGVVFSLAAGLFGAPIPPGIDQEVVRPLRHPLALWVKGYGYDSALANFESNKHSLFLYREFVSDNATWREIRRRRLFPLHRPRRFARSSTPGVPARLAAGVKHSSYIARRLLHHTIAAADYAWETIQWERRKFAHR